MTIQTSFRIDLVIKIPSGNSVHIQTAELGSMSISKPRRFDIGANSIPWPSISTSKQSICYILGFHDLDDCSLNLHLADSTIKKPMGRINDVIIVANRNLVPVDFIVLHLDCNLSCPIILGRPFLRTIGAIIDMKEGNIRFQFPLRKCMEHFPKKKIKFPYESIMRATYGLHTKDDNT